MRTRDERAATLVEYVLFVSGFVLIAITAVGGMNSTARSYFQQSSSRIGQPANRIQYDANGNRQRRRHGDRHRRSGGEQPDGERSR